MRYLYVYTYISIFTYILKCYLIISKMNRQINRSQFGEGWREYSPICNGVPNTNKDLSDHTRALGLDDGALASLWHYLTQTPPREHIGTLLGVHIEDLGNGNAFLLFYFYPGLIYMHQITLHDDKPNTELKIK